MHCQNILKPVVAKLKEAGVTVEEEIDGIRVISTGKGIKAVDIKTLPYPGFPTDMQAQFMALTTIAEGTSTVTETVFENRFMHVAELRENGCPYRYRQSSSDCRRYATLTWCWTS